MNSHQAPVVKEDILIIDDTPDNLRLLSTVLQSRGYRVRKAINGQLALKGVQITPPDLILLDVNMPIMNGYEVCELLKANPQTSEIPVIFLSALDDVSDKVKAFAVGGVDYITKPFQSEEVLARVKNQLVLRSLSKQLSQQNELLQQEIRDRKLAEEALLDSAIRLRNQNLALMELARNQALNQGDLKVALKEITQATAHNIAVERVSVWLYDETGTKIQCLDLFELSVNQHSEGVELAEVDYPFYFQALTQDQLIAADDAHTDCRTQEFSQSYLTPLGIASMLDAPIRLGGQTVGVLCNEQIGQTRHWTPEDQNFARSIADLVSLALEAQERKRAEEALRQSEARERQKAKELELALDELKRTQGQLIQTEKMSSLGQMVAGVAHEINNPVSFIYGNLAPAREYIQALLRLIQSYQDTYPDPTPEIQQIREEIDLDFLVEDWQQLIDSMQVGAERIHEIVRSLQIFSRQNEFDLKPVDIHQGIDNTLLILQHRLRAVGSRPSIEVVKHYGQLPQISCYASQLNQVFMNLLNNAIDALQNQPSPRVITIHTEVRTGELGTEKAGHGDTGAQGHEDVSTKLPASSHLPLLTSSFPSPIPNPQFVVIRIADNGSGMSEAVRQKIFDPFFTTKPVGSGMGLGLSISYQIVVEKHGGQLSCISAPGQGTELIMEIPVRVWVDTPTA
jgi:signal transduction histidine kinase/DNA-binding response OmpR family regulator